MDISTAQIKKAKNEISQKKLIDGSLPSISDINNYINEKFENSEIGLPLFHPKFISEENKLSNPTSMNYMIRNIYEDLQTLYYANNDCNDCIISLFNYYNIEKERINSSIENILNSIGNLDDLDDNIIYENIDDFSKIDFAGDKNRNINKTTSFIDLNNKCISNNDININSKINLENANINLKINSNMLYNIVISDLNNTLNDNKNEFWLQKITTKDDMGVSFEVALNLNKKIKITNISLNIISTKNVSIRAILYNNDIENKLNIITTNKVASWNFKESECNKIIFKIVKSESDSSNGVNYDYYIGSNNISLYNKIYEPTSVFVSKQFKINKEFNSVLAKIDQSIPTSTSIKYFLGIDDNKSPVSWISIKDNKLNDLGLLNKTTENINPELNSNSNTYNDNLYILGELLNKPSPNNIHVFLGDNMWKRQSSDKEELTELFKSETIEFIEMNKIVYKQDKNKNYLYTTYVYCEKSVVLPIELTEKTKLIVNDIDITSFTTEKVIRLNIGWNKINIISLKTEELLINCYFKDNSSIVRAFKDEIEEIDLYEMKNNNYKTNYYIYAIDNNKIIVNYNPKEINLHANCKYLYTNNQEYFKNINIRLLAILNSNDKNVTPIIYKYSINLF